MIPRLATTPWARRFFNLLAAAFLVLCLGFAGCWAQWHWQRGEIFDFAVGHQCVELFIDDGITLTWSHVPTSLYPGHHFWRWTIANTSNGNVTFNTDPDNDSVEPLDSNDAGHRVFDILGHAIMLSGDRSPAAVGLYVKASVGCLFTAVVPLIWLTRRLWQRTRRAPHVCPSCGYDLRASPERCPECGAVCVKGSSQARP